MLKLVLRREVETKKVQTEKKRVIDGRRTSEKPGLGELDPEDGV